MDRGLQGKAALVSGASKGIGRAIVQRLVAEGMQVLGIARYGQFLGGSACQLIADQIIRHGAVRRATLAGMS